jgi:hypothetical protein
VGAYPVSSHYRRHFREAGPCSTQRPKNSGGCSTTPSIPYQPASLVSYLLKESGRTSSKEPYQWWAETTNIYIYVIASSRLNICYHMEIFHLPNLCFINHSLIQSSNLSRLLCLLSQIWQKFLIPTALVWESFLEGPLCFYRPSIQKSSSGIMADFFSS